MKKLLFAYFMLSSIWLMSQTETENHSNKEVLLYFGYHSPRISELNELLVASNYPKFNVITYSSGFGIVEFSKKDIVSQQQLFIFAQIQKNDSLTSSLRSISFGQSLFGYSLVNSAKFRIYSMIGMISHFTQCKLSNNLGSNNTFNSYLAGNANQHEMNILQFTMNGTTALNYYVKLPKSKSQLVFGLRTEYSLPLFSRKWTMNKTKLNDGPKINPGGGALHLTVGITI
jgi:hypothetical protein